MRATLAFLAISLVFTAACKKTSGAGDAIAKMTAFKDKMCACKDKACVDQVSGELVAWSAAQKPERGSEQDRDKLVALSDELNRCMTGVATAAGSAGAPGETAGAGSADPGSAADGAAAGAAPGADGMANRAGMCPSTVLGATTTVAVAGKAVVVTIASADQDAIGAIQRRADELLAQKKDAAVGTAHDQKGTHGGRLGLCPVYVPEGATATAKPDAKGVVVTITPSGNPEELAKEIDGRIAKADGWVKANVKTADKGNQGGVGGGKGEDGSNHSGKGDGKGRERKGDGGGGGKGTGGGGATGTGGGAGKGGGSAKPAEPAGGW